tara:strand:- start:23020 stop:23160 length:141 start_codon:yes stop_codon:yes gene_type:complete
MMHQVIPHTGTEEPVKGSSNPYYEYYITGQGEVVLIDIEPAEEREE